MREIVGELAADGPTPEEVERARAYAAGRRVLAFENTNAVARYAANQRIVFDEDIDPDAAIALLDAATFDEVAEAARTVDPDKLAVACVGPHESGRVLILVKPLAGRASGWVRMLCVPVAEALNERELSRYVSRVSDRWPLSSARCWAARAPTTPSERRRSASAAPSTSSSSSPSASTACPGSSASTSAARCGTRPRWATTPTSTATRRSSSSASARACRSCAGVSDHGFDLLAA